MPRVALVLVSHSAAVAEGTAEIARQMAPDVLVLPAGGIEEGIGTSFDRVLSALVQAADQADGVVVLTDLGSAVLTTESVLETEDDLAARVRVPSAPFVEGAVAAAVQAQQGGDLEAVAEAAVRAGSMFASAQQGLLEPTAGEPATTPSAVEEYVAGTGHEVAATVVLANRLGLHARPAALLARTVADSGAHVTVDGVDGASVLALMALGATGGQELTVRATGAGAQAALDEVVALLESGFGET